LFQLEDPAELKSLKGLNLIDFKLEGNPVVSILKDNYTRYVLTILSRISVSISIKISYKHFNSYGTTEPLKYLAADNNTTLLSYIIESLLFFQHNAEAVPDANAAGECETYCV